MVWGVAIARHRQGIADPVESMQSVEGGKVWIQKRTRTIKIQTNFSTEKWKIWFVSQKDRLGHIITFGVRFFADSDRVSKSRQSVKTKCQDKIPLLFQNDHVPQMQTFGFNFFLESVRIQTKCQTRFELDSDNFLADPLNQNDNPNNIFYPFHKKLPQSSNHKDMQGCGLSDFSYEDFDYRTCPNDDIRK